MEMVRLKCGFVNGIDIDAIGSSLVSLRSYSQFHMDVDIYDHENGKTLIFTGPLKNGIGRGLGSFFGNWIMIKLPLGFLNDLGFVDRWFTWERGRFRSTNIRERLDRGVASLSWMNLFPNYSTRFRATHFQTIVRSS
ncbi:hypothetical protein EPI10_021727 [Gossypium australe]|uniref:Reverse transcriptase n=1 Tax=Gossypium australe TaxID=47621 RepID=A0A5B6WJL1_9ROSI|nr:hypothetical protein EPI10_021727 [Gossypium australe]